ncbi:hypothetical protein PFISCL1PPCAC_20157 [Pristionchus fissidentatus]|uniref:Uncharacterized protein n=1 Tax=Pristionchus fissidentatus TaxID=1538716 RepID=A0AAV5WEG9_9BILA|nr:hypothetical protein PFISCL1PPCAC_20157 [Pristionchus fissidentatus]
MERYTWHIFMLMAGFRALLTEAPILHSSGDFKIPSATVIMRMKSNVIIGTEKGEVFYLDDSLQLLYTFTPRSGPISFLHWDKWPKLWIGTSRGSLISTQSIPSIDQGRPQSLLDNDSLPSPVKKFMIRRREKSEENRDEISPKLVALCEDGCWNGWWFFDGDWTRE